MRALRYDTGKPRILNSKSGIDTDGSWAVSYGDMITLLLTFFILFFSMDVRTKKQNHFKMLQESLLKSLNLLRPAATSDGFQTQLNLGVVQGKHIDESLLKSLGADVYRVGDAVVVEFPDVSFFEFGEIDVTRPGEAALRKFTQVYLPFTGSFKLSIRAFTDYVPVLPRPGRRYNDNLELSALRSVAAMRTLQREGIPLVKMKIAGYGEHRLHEREEAQAEDAAKKDESKGVPLARKVALIIEPDDAETRGAK